MFTGIISHTGTFCCYAKGKQQIIIDSQEAARETVIGGSLSVNGVCLSLVSKTGSRLTFDLSRETSERSTLGRLQAREILNLESPLTLSSPLSGHMVTGHIDFTGKILILKKTQNGKRLGITYPPEQRPYIIPKGSVAVDGISLTVAGLTTDCFEVELIPITLKTTNINARKRGDLVNIECDMIGKYVYNYISNIRKPLS
ncbi:MAG: riboflavin synthase [Candidatus Aminicenantes bacterium]|nr:riboflavin synthase [Candidatus Aminicenantes bacterium]